MSGASSRQGSIIRRAPLQSSAGSSDISGLLSQKPISEGPSQSALDDDKFIRNILRDYEKVKQIIDSLNEMRIYGQIKQFDPNDKIYQLAQKARARASVPPVKREIVQNVPSLMGRQTQPSMVSVDFDEYRDEVTDNLNPNLCHICHLTIGTRPKNCEFCC